jgi:hypothetical protein
VLEDLGGFPTGLAYAADGPPALAISAGGQVVLWDGKVGKNLPGWHFPGAVNGVAYAADGRHLATANNNGTVYILRLALAPAR